MTCVPFLPVLFPCFSHTRGAFAAASQICLFIRSTHDNCTHWKCSLCPMYQHCKRFPWCCPPILSCTAVPAARAKSRLPREGGKKRKTEAARGPDFTLPLPPPPDDRPCARPTGQRRLHPRAIRREEREGGKKKKTWLHDALTAALLVKCGRLHAAL